MSSLPQNAMSEVVRHSPEPSIFTVVCEQLLCLLGPRFTAADIKPESLLVEDLGLDSLKFVDLTVRIEDAFGLATFPMQDWVDSQVAEDVPLSVGALAHACTNEVIRQQRGLG